MTSLTDSQRLRVEANLHLIALAARRRSALDRDGRESAAGFGLIEAAADPRAPEDPEAFRRFALTRIRWRIGRDARAAARHACESDEVPDRVDPSARHEALADIRDEFDALVLSHLHLLSPRQQEAIRLHLNGLSVPEIAARQGITAAMAWNDRNATVRKLRAIAS